MQLEAAKKTCLKNCRSSAGLFSRIYAVLVSGGVEARSSTSCPRSLAGTGPDRRRETKSAEQLAEQYDELKHEFEKTRSETP